MLSYKGSRQVLGKRSSESNASHLLMSEAIEVMLFNAVGKGTGWITALTILARSSSSRFVSFWCKELNLLIFSWSSRRTSISSLPAEASSSFVSWAGISGVRLNTRRDKNAPYDAA